MITIDPLDDEVVKKAKPERSKLSEAQRLRQQPDRAGLRPEKKTRSRLLALALRLLRGGTGEEE
jgi:hypothetical protein